MRSRSSLSFRCALLIVILSPALLGSSFKCVAVSNPSVTTARIGKLDPAMPRVGEIMQVTGSGDCAPPLQFAWDFGDGVSAAGMQAAHTYIAAGNYRVMLTVRDAMGNIASDSSQVTVSPRMSTAALSAGLMSGAVTGQPVVLVASSPEENASALTYTWTFSDGQSAVGPQVAAMFPVAGAYVATVTMTTASGGIAIAQVPFQVVDAAH
ncbi:MAG TPA: PKD domain-containing protein [Povalibacter sp.]|nr:PKD domain-containing protein [Povalibacter sp.]